MTVTDRARTLWFKIPSGYRLLIAGVLALLAVVIIWWLAASIGGFFNGRSEAKYQERIAAAEQKAQAAHDQAVQQKAVADQKAQEAQQALQELNDERQARINAEAEVDRLRANTTAARGRYDTARARVVPKRNPADVPDDAGLCADARAAGIQCP